MYAVNEQQLHQWQSLAPTQCERDTSTLLVSTFVASSYDTATRSWVEKAMRQGRYRGHLAAARARERAFAAAQRDGWSRTDAGAMHLNQSNFLATPEQFGRLL